MKKFYHNKLVRDKIPEIIEADNEHYELRVMEEDEFKRELKKKLIEESKEIVETKKEDLVKELADVLEIVKSIAESEDISFELVEEKQKARKEKRGGFQKKLFLIWSSKPAGQ